MLNERNTLLEDDGIEEEILVEEECSVAQAVWGDIQGNIENQTDLQNALDSKQDSLTEAQLNAVNSGITAEKVTTCDGYADQIASKADQSALNAEATTREQADTALGTRIDNEALARQQADNGLQTQIDAITSKSDVVDVVANYAALQAYDTSSLGNNDVIKVLDDETHEDALTYYRWSTTTQTWSYIGQEAPYYSKGQMDVKLAEKQDKLTAGANIQIQNGTISATDTTYTAGNGLNLNGTEFSADTTMLATKEDLEGYYTKPETDTLLAPKLEAEVVAELPTAGEEGKLYLTPKAHTTQTATGNPITATVAEEAGALESFQLDGDTFQQSYTGKNLFDIEQYSNAILRGGGTGVSLEKIDSRTLRATNEISQLNNFCGIPVPNYTELLGQTVTVSGSMTSHDVPNTRIIFGWYIGSVSVFGSSLSLNQDGTFSLTQSIPASAPSGATGLLVVIYANGSVNAGDIGSYVDWSDIQLEVGISATSYEPYVGGVPSPNPDYPQTIQTVSGTQTVTIASLNLFDGIFELGDISTTTGTDINADTMIRSKNYAVIEGGESYTISVVGGGNVALRFYQSNGTFIGTGTTAASPNTFTAPANAGRVRFVVTSNTNLSTKAQCEKGSSATTWTPYYEPVSYPLDLGNIELCKLGDYQDYIYKNGEDWKIHKATNTKVYDGTTNKGFYYRANTNVSGKYRFQLDGSEEERSIAQSSSTANFIGLCNELPVGSRNMTFQLEYLDGNTIAPITATSYGNIGVIYAVAISRMTLDQANAWLATHNMVVTYALATPTDTTITDQTLIAQLEAIRTASLENGTNTITNTATGSNLAGDMEIGYYGFNPRNRYDKWLWLDINNNYEQIGS